MPVQVLSRPAGSWRIQEEHRDGGWQGCGRGRSHQQVPWKRLQVVGCNAEATAQTSPSNLRSLTAQRTLACAAACQAWGFCNKLVSAAAVGCACCANGGREGVWCLILPDWDLRSVLQPAACRLLSWVWCWVRPPVQADAHAMCPACIQDGRQHLLLPAGGGVAGAKVIPPVKCWCAAPGKAPSTCASQIACNPRTQHGNAPKAAQTDSSCHTQPYPQPQATASHGHAASSAAGCCHCSWPRQPCAVSAP